MADNNLNIAQASIGLNLDRITSQVSSGMLTYSLNAQTENYDGTSVTYQNESANTLCVSFPEGYVAIGKENIIQLSKVIYFITNPTTGNSQIGSTDLDGCVYTPIIDDANNDLKLQFNIEYPIQKVIVKTTNCSTQFYWTDGLNPRRYVDLNNLPWKDEPNPVDIFNPIQLIGQLDTNKILVQPNFSIPIITPISVLTGGELVTGTYQFAIQYCSIRGVSHTPFFSITSPLSIFENEITPNFNTTTTQAISINISNLDTTALYSYFNIAVIKTINAITSVDLVGTFPIGGQNYNYTYTGTEKSPIVLTIDDIFQKQDYYDTAQDVFEVNNIIGWDNLTSSEVVNYQQIWSNVHLQWETWKVPYNQFEGYNNGINTESLRGYMRDEVYPFEGCFLLQNGMQTNSFHIPGRVQTDFDIIPPVATDNLDSASILTDPCANPILKPRWQVYNTGTLIGYTNEYLTTTISSDCYVGSYQYGEMSYWESTDTYPNNLNVWGDLANKPIRHHKFPDSIITHIHDVNNTVDNNPSFQHSIFPIGVRIDANSLYQAILTSNLTQEQKNQIVGFKITRGNRVNNKTVIAKGLFNNVGKYTYVPPLGQAVDEQTYYYPNYPYNDLSPDPFFTQNLIKDHSGFRPDQALNGFSSDDGRSRFVFHSPDTHFYQPSLDAGLYTKIETIEYGESYGHFVAVDEDAKYLFLNANGYKVAFGAGVASVVNGVVTYTTPWDYQIGANLAPENFGPSFTAMLDILNKTLPYNIFTYSFNSYGLYNKFYPVPNDIGNKIRAIDFCKYLDSNYDSIENGNIINNYNREGSVYLNTNNNLPYPNEYDSSITPDTSRYTLSSYLNIAQLDDFFNEFLANNNIITIDEIQDSIPNSSFQGPPVLVFNISTYNLQDFIPTINSIYKYTSNNNTIGTLQIIDINLTLTSQNIGSNIVWSQAGTITALLLTGELNQIEGTCLYGSNNTSGTGTSQFVYNNQNQGIPSQVGIINQLVFDSGVDTSLYVNFDSFSPTTYAQSLLGDNSNAYSGIYDAYTTPPITSIEGINALNISNPSTIEDFNSIIAYDAFYEAYSAYLIANSELHTPETVRQANISSYYGSIKNNLLNPYGQIYSYETIDTGFYTTLFQSNGTNFIEFDTVFGGDIFINRFAFKNKFPFFEDNTVKDPDQTDIQYDQIANLTYPMFWFSTRPVDTSTKIANDVSQYASKIINNMSTADALQWIIGGIEAGVMTFDILKDILKYLAVRNVNLDNNDPQQLYEKGLIYLFAYGIPYFFVESEVNTDYRQATNEREGNFYPNVSKAIPDDWVQEANVSIELDNSYNYNQTYSKQNKENLFTHLRPDFDPNEICFTYFPNRAIWSETSSVEDLDNNWLTYKPANYKDLPKSYGSLTSIDSLENNQLLVRFANKSQLYNAVTTVNVSKGQPASLGTGKLFEGQVIDLSHTDIGYAGSQHKLLLKTEFGSIFVDALRGQIINMSRGGQMQDLADRGLDKWFSANLPFNILKVSPNIDIDNNFNGIGLHGVYDAFYQRIILTKIDYLPLVTIDYIDNQFIVDGKVVALDDDNYFCNKSWTLSYCFKTNAWTSFHSYIPQFYIGYPNYFQSGFNSQTWTHDRSITNYTNFYGNQCRYILEYPFTYKIQDEILQNVKDYTSARKYIDFYSFYEPDETIYFNKAILYNSQQCSGILNLIPKQKNNLATYNTYPKLNSNSKDILLVKSDNFYNYNTFWSILKDNSQPMFFTSCDMTKDDKALNQDNLDYTNRDYRKAQIRAKDLKIRNILDNRNDIRLISHFVISPTAISYK